jgi:KUP system potassium uptake protein
MTDSNFDIHSTYADQHIPKEAPKGNYLAVLSLAALGVVYGDIGTSPLYAIRECFHGPHAVSATPGNILGVLSLIFWSLILVVTVKYLVFVVRADNHGEGGILSLAALSTPISPSGRSEKWILIVIGIFGASLLYGDGVLTPAISILGAMEGLTVATPVLTPFIIPFTVAILVALFMIQSRGTAGIGKIFGPVTLVWFTVIGLLGVFQIFHFPQVISAVNPAHAFSFFAANGWHGFIILGSVFLVVTGGEALYADMGHFGVKPIRYAWFLVVLPCLLLNYFGQGALLLEDPTMAPNPFYNLAPSWGVYPLIVLATAAAVIASQALISASFSLTMQAVQLGLLPRLKITHTSSREYGQIYLPAINWALMIGCIVIVLGFKSSSNLAAAYGIAVTFTMVITTILFYVVARNRWNWSRPVALGFCGFFIVIDLSFFGANLIKFFDGGWFPITLAVAIFTIMMTWKKGRSILTERIQGNTELLEDFLKKIKKHALKRVQGTAVFMNGNATRTPPALLLNMEHNKVLHEQILFVTIKTRPIPYVSNEERFAYEHLGNGFHRLKLYYGYMDEPNIPKDLALMPDVLFRFDSSQTTYFLGRETIISTKSRSGMARWREKLFAVLSKNAQSATTYFGIPPERVVELGSQIEI